MKLSVRGHRSSIHRPLWQAFWISTTRACVSLGWGEPGSDPVWSVDVEFDVPPVVARRLP